MPELPEVEIARRDLLRWLSGRRLLSAAATPGKPLRNTSPAAVARLAGRTVKSIDRRGKHLLWTLDGGVGIHQHLGMTGKLVWRAARSTDEPPFSRVQLGVKGGVVHFQDARRFGRFEIVRAADLDALPELRELGPDALNALPAAADLPTVLCSPRRPIKLALMDQTTVAGLGNILAAEIL